VVHIRNYGCADELTGLANRSYGEMKVAQAIDALERFGLPFGWLRIALDNMEELEHRYGHGFVDAAVTVVARTLDYCLGPIDTLMRWGRTEFAAVIRRGDADELLEIERRCVVLARCSKVGWWGDGVRVTISAGGALAVRGDSLESLEFAAEEALRTCMQGGGNRALALHAHAAEAAAENPFQIV